VTDDPILAQVARLPAEPGRDARPAADWLVAPVAAAAGVYRGTGGGEIVLHNGLIRRGFRLAPGTGMIAFDNLMTGEALLRAVGPEARLTLDGCGYQVGGLLGQKEFAYLSPRELARLAADPEALPLRGFEVGPIRPRLAWTRVRHAGETVWPPRGLELRLAFACTRHPGVTVTVHHELYDGLPLLCKWVTVDNAGADAVTLDTLTTEILSLPEGESIVDPLGDGVWSTPDLHVESDYAFGGMETKSSARVIHWVTDPRYSTQVNYELRTPCILESRIPHGPAATIAPGEAFTSHRTWELVHDSHERERRALAQRRMYRCIAPWATENPLMMHVVSRDEGVIRQAIDQCADVGFELVILSFGSGVNLEDRSPANLAFLQRLNDHARGRGVELGGYSLLASRSVGPETDIVPGEEPFPHSARFGQSPCLGSAWGRAYFAGMQATLQETGLGAFENDGAYPGDHCGSAAHPGHRGLLDSQWTQWRAITAFYMWCRARGVYLNVPDWYFLSGSNKCGMGYRETNFSLPRERQVLLSRQNIYDGTWQKTPSMGWMFVPLTQYHGGGEAATIEPLREHLDVYEAHLLQTLGLGVQACWRGPRLYDAPATRDLLKRYVDWFKRHRAILESDVIHVRRPDGRNVDCMLHVNPRLREKGVALVWNPLDEAVETTLTLPLYYTGLTGAARIREQEGPEEVHPLDRGHTVEIAVRLPPGRGTWFVIEGDG